MEPCTYWLRKVRFCLRVAGPGLRCTMMPTSAPTTYAKMVVPTTWIAVVTSTSCVAFGWGVMSPYPIVVMVVNAQYRDTRYCRLLSSLPRHPPPPPPPPLVGWASS